MRKTTIFILTLLFAGVSAAGEGSRIFFPDLLPANTIACIVPPDSGSLERDFSSSLFQHINELPEMAPFLRNFEESRQALTNDLATNGHIPPQLASELIRGRLGLAVINVGMGRDGRPLVEFAAAIALKSQPDRATVYAAVMALLNRPEVVRTVLESQGLDPNLPIKTLAQEETISGYPPILRIGPNIRVAAVGNLVMLYHGPGSEGIKKLFDAASNTTASLTRNASFQAAYRGAESGPGASFAYVNVPRLMAVLDAVNLSAVTRIIEATGIGSVQAVGMAGAYHQGGVRHSMYLHSPGGQMTGLLSTLVPMPQGSPIGMEGFGQAIPSAADSFTALRVDLPAFLRELPYFLDSIAAVARPGGVTGVVTNETVLGVPLAELVATLGGDILVRPHDDTLVVTFHNVDIAGFEAALGRMEQNAGARFSSLDVGGYTVRYFNRRSSLTVPLAPAFCLVPRGAGSPRGVLYMASHPQAVVSLIRESTSAREPLSGTQDFQKTASGMGGNYSLYYYNSDKECYRRVYNFLLPVASLWAGSARYPVDTGLLPTAASILPGFFGCALGVRLQPDGMLVQAYSPVGANAVPIVMADKLIVSNPLVIGYTYGLIETWMKTLPMW